MSEPFQYPRKLKDYGKPCNFSDTPIKVMTAEKREGGAEDYVVRDPNFISLDNIPELSESTVNTERVSTGEKGFHHKEGGWPKSVDPSDIQEVQRYLKKNVERDPAYLSAIKDLCKTVEGCIDQNNQIDLFEEYFVNEQSEHFVENLSTKTLMLFKDPNEHSKRSVSKIAWHPEGPNKLAVAYAVMRFQQMPEKMPFQSYIWDLNSPNIPEKELISPSPLTALAYNLKAFDIIGGGCYNGVVAIWDFRNKDKQYGISPVIVAPVEKGHHDPVTDFVWVSSKTGTEFATVSTDGRICWWDMRKPNEECADSLILTENITGGTDGKTERVVGGTCIEYMLDAGPMKYLVGTEQGSILSVNKRQKKDKSVEVSQRYGIDSGRHFGPITGLQRNPLNYKYFLSVGDWTAKIWHEELKTPIIRTRYHPSHIMDGCWSPSRQGVFFIARRDGWLDVWDYYYRQNEIAFSHKVSDSSLTSIKIFSQPGVVQNNGRLVAVGDQDGTVTLLELCDSLYRAPENEKDVISEIFDREYRKEKMLELQKKASEAQKKTVRETGNNSAQEAKKQELLRKAEENFWNKVGKSQQNGEVEIEGGVQKEDNQDQESEDRDRENGQEDGENEGEIQGDNQEKKENKNEDDKK